jgi:mannose-1-phosphate guanylyltransferase/phosphomannomutase
MIEQAYRSGSIQAVVLAGGKGTRLKPVTYQIPKVMVNVCGRPFLQHQIELLKSFKIKQILLLVGYLKNDIKEYFKDGSRFGVDIDYSCEENLLGTGGALKNAKDKLSEEFLLLNGDTFLPIDYNEFIRYSKKCRTIAVIAAYNNLEKKFSNNLAVEGEGEVIGYDKRNPGKMTHVDSGAMILKKEALKYIPDNRVCSFEEEIFHKLIAKREMSAFISGQRFYDMGSFEGLKLLTERLK